MQRSPRMLCVGLDAYVLADVRSSAPDAVLLHAQRPEDVLRELAREPDAIIHSGGPLATLLAEAAARTPTIGIVDATHDARGLPGEVLRRPVDRILLRRALDRSRQRTVLAGLRRRLFDPTTSWAPERVFSLLRLSLLVLVIVDLLGIRNPTSQVPELATVAIAAAATAHAIARIRWSRMSLGLVASDAALWTLLSLLPADPRPPFGVLLVLAIAELGFLRDIRATLWAVVVGLAFATLSSDQPGTAEALVLVPLMVLAGCLGAGIAIVIGNGGRAGRRVLQEVHTALLGLHEHALTNPGRLEVGRVRRDAVSLCHRELAAARVALADLGAVGGPILVRSQPSDPVAKPPWDGLGDVARSLHTATTTEDPALRALVGDPQGPVMVAPLRADHGARGLLVVGWDHPLPGRARRRAAEQLLELATDVTISLENAELFHAIDELSAKGERVRLARELHDGLVQSFVHVGFELEALARGLADVDVPAALKVVDLRHVVADVVAETRAAIGHLRDDALDEGLDGAVRRWLQAAPSASGPAVSYRPSVPDPLPPEVVPDLLRVVQEAVGNARQHARANHVDVATRTEGQDLVVVVEDDGIGLGGRPATGHGVGIRSMQERLHRLGGSLRVETIQPHGTRVTATVPGLMSTGSVT